MATYPRCRDCGNDLVSHEEQEQELCFNCQQYYAQEIFICHCGWKGTQDELETRWLPDPQHPDEVNPEICCPICKSPSLEILGH